MLIGYALLAALPIILIVILMVGFSWPARKSMPCAWFVSVTIALVVWRMEPIRVLAASIEGSLGALNIIMIIFGALFLLNMMKQSGAMEIIKQSFSDISSDQRVQAIIIGWVFASFIEGAAGFGTPAALAAPLLVGMGFPPIPAAMITLLFNSTSVAFGAVGTTLVVGIGNSISGLLPETVISMNEFIHQVGIWGSLFHFCIGSMLPLIGICMMTRFFGTNRSFREGLEVAPFALFSGFCFTSAMLLISTLFGPELPSVIGGFVALVIVISTARMGFLMPKRTWRFSFEEENLQDSVRELPNRDSPNRSDHGSFRIQLKSWTPYLIIGAFLVITRIPNSPIQLILRSWSISWNPILDQTGISYRLDPLYSPGIIPFFGVAMGLGALYRMKRKKIGIALSTTLGQTFSAMVPLVFAVAMVRVLVQSGENPSGLSSMLLTLSSAVSNFAGSLWPIFAPFVGVLGSFSAGSHTVSNLLFGGFQYEVADQLGLSRTIIVSLQTVGGAIGNMICVHNIVAVCAVLGTLGKEGTIIRMNLIPVIGYALLSGLLGLIFTYFWGYAFF